MLRNKNDHTYRHTIIVCLYCYKLAVERGVSESDTMTLLISALIHDCGRTNNGNDKDHGKKSFEKFKKLNYDDVEFLVTNHCLKDNGNNLLLKILKDADALDRQRNDDLDIKKLRLVESKNMVKFAKEIIDATA